MKIELRPLENVKPYEKNPRLNDAAVAGVVASLKEFGFRQPIVVDKKGVIIVGHTRWKAAKELGLEKVPVHVALDLSPAKIRAYRLADNKTHEASEWDLNLLPLELAAVQEDGFDLTELGWNGDELRKLLAPLSAGADPDEIPAPPAKAKTQPGDLWILGDHRLLCGDSSKPEDVDRLLAGETIHLVNSDPPYNVKVEPRSNNAIAAGLSSFGSATHHQSFDAARRPSSKKATDKQLRAKDRPLANDFVTDAAFDKLLRAWFGNMARVLAPGHAFYIWGGFSNCANYPPALAEAGLYFSQAIIWFKNQPVITRKDFMTNHEWCFYGWREGASHRFFGPKNIADTWHITPFDAGEGGTAIADGLRLESGSGSRLDIAPPRGEPKRVAHVGEEGIVLCDPRTPTDAWHVKKVPGQKMVHLTEKPVELATRAMEYSSQPGENVLDLFGGSGSTLIAAEMTGRRAFLTELDPLYCDVIVERWERFTGRKASREGATSTRPKARQKASA